MMLKRAMVESLSDFSGDDTPASKMLPRGAMMLIAATVKSGTQKTFTGSLIDHLSRSLAKSIRAGKVSGICEAMHAKKP